MAYLKPEHCPYCSNPEYIKKGYYKTKHNGQPVPRYRCKSCRKLFSTQSLKSTYRQKKPGLNKLIFNWYCSGVTQRRIAKNLGCNRKTVARKFFYLSLIAKFRHEADIKSGNLQSSHIEFDEMETYEHSIGKPISMAIAVDSESGKIIDINAASIKFHTKGKHRYLLKYGDRPSLRRTAIQSTLQTISLIASKNAKIVTDSKGDYGLLIKKWVDGAKHIKKTRKPPRDLSVTTHRRNKEDDMWRINHTCAKLRHDLVRLGRKTWSTTKAMWALQAHLYLYIAFNNGYKIC